MSVSENLGDVLSRFFLTLTGNDDVQVLRFTAQESLNRPWELDITLVSEAENISPEKMVGSKATLTLLGSSGRSYYHGQVWRFRRQTQGKRLTQYRLVMRPPLSWLGLGRNQRIFQQKSVPDIIKLLLQERHIASDQVQWKLSGTYTARDYCVQYGESDLQFITRLLGEEGIHYHFAHDEGGSKLIFADHPSGWSTGLAFVQYKPGTGQAADEDTLQSFQVRHAVSANMASRRYFDLHKPLQQINAEQKTPPVAGNQSLKGNDSACRDHLNHYDYNSAEQQSISTAQQIAKRHLESLQRARITALGRGNLSQLRTGWLFPIRGHGRAEFNSNWLLTEVSLSGEQPQVLEEFGGGQSSLTSQFSAIPWDTPWRPDFAPEKPLLCGIQTARVTGPAGEEIYTDELGRIKVQFHWDREGKEDERTSCWIRVMHDWAGNGYGVVRLPRIGQEVQVSFEDGNPDKPLITGCLHNGEQKTAWELPVHMTRSGIRTCSSPGGGGANELRFEDKKGKEELRWQAEKDWDAKILNCSHTRIDGTYARAIGGNDYRKIEGEQHIILEADTQKEIGSNQHCTIHGSQEQHIAQKSLIRAGQDMVWQSKSQAIYHAGTELTLLAGGSFIKLDPGGITLSGPVVAMNQGGSALSADSESAVLPHKPAGAHSAGRGKVPQAKVPEKVVKTEHEKVYLMVYSD